MSDLAAWLCPDCQARLDEAGQITLSFDARRDDPPPGRCWSCGARRLTVVPDDEILGRLLRRFLTDEDEYASTSTGELVLDGRIRVTGEELAAVDRARHPAPLRQVLLGETFDLAPHEQAEVVMPGNDGRIVFWSIDGGEGGIKGARIG